MDGKPPDDPGTKKKWYGPRWWWAIAGVGLIGAAAVVAVISTQPAAKVFAIRTSSHPRPPVQNAVGAGYLANESDGVVFVQWTQSGTNLSGSAQVETLTGSPPNQSVSSNTISVTGRLNGSTITLSFDGGTTVFGTLSNGAFTVNFPQSDGSLAAVNFTSATASQFNQALEALQGNIGGANQSAAAAETVTSEQQSIDQAASTVENDMSIMQTDSQKLAADLGGFANDLAQIKADLVTTAQGEQAVIAESKNGTDPNQVCSDSDTVQSDADTVGSDGDTVSATADNVESDVSSLHDDISRIQQDFATLQTAQSQQPSYSDGAPSESTVDQAEKAAQAATTVALGTANGAIGQANGYETQAYNDAVAAAQAGNCSPPATQFTQPTIS